MIPDKKELIGIDQLSAKTEGKLTIEAKKGKERGGSYNILFIEFASEDRYLNMKPKLGSLYIYSALKETDFELNFVNPGLNPEVNILEEVKREQPKFVCISLMETYLASQAYKLIDRIKQEFPTTTIITG